MKRSALSMFRSQSKSYRCLMLLVASVIMLVPSFFNQQVVYAQVSKGSVSGSVVDAQGASVPDALIKIVNKGTNETVTVTSDGAGLFRFALLSIGTHRLEISKAGFNRTALDNIEVTLGADRGLGLLARLQNEDHFVVLQRQRFIPPPSDRAIWRRSALPWVDVLTDVPAAEQG